MILNLFIVLISISLILIIIGLVKHTESAQAIVGFTFLFLLSFVLMDGNLEYETGTNTTTDYIYNVNGTVDNTLEISNKTFTNFDDDNSFKMGLYLAIVSAVGFAGTLWGLKNTRWGEE